MTRKYRIVRIAAIVTVLAAFGSRPMVFAQSKPFPAGIIRFFSTKVSRPENDPSWNNVNLDGVRLRPIWSDLAPSRGVYDWSSVDAIFAIAAEHDRTIGLSVTAGLGSPQWVYDAGATKYDLRDGSGGSMPLPWDQGFQRKWLPFVEAMGRRYEGNPYLGYVVISGLSQEIETRLSSSPADDAPLRALGGVDAWVAAAKKIIGVYASAFPTTPFFITASRVFTDDDENDALRQVIDWGVATYPGRFGLMNATLNADSSTGYYPNEAIYTYKDTQPVGFQMLVSSIKDPVRLRGTLDEALLAGIALGAEFVEVYQSDADAPENQAVLAREGDALEANVTVGTFANISTRTSVGTIDNALIGGLIITGTQAKKVIVRALGPSLPVPGALADPILELHDSADLTIATNDNWQDSSDRQAIIDSTVPPSDDRESAIIITLDPGAYTAVVRGVSDTTGVGLVEIYDLDRTVDSRLANISTRGSVQTDDNVMIGGFIIGGSNGGSSKMVVRAIGPSLTALGVAGALQDPFLEIHDTNGIVIASNNNWRDTQASEIESAGLAPTDDRESAIVITLQSGAYTTIVRGTNNTVGVGLVEAYNVP
jgi:hypothetical protein